MKICLKLLITVMAMTTALLANAQAYPGKSILMIIPLQAASAIDVAIRIVTQKMSENMGQQIVIDNQPGAAGLIGAERVMRATPDGYTIATLNTPKEIISRLNAEIIKALNSTDVRERLTSQGFEVFGSPPEQVTSLTRARFEQMTRIIKEAGISIE